jgi:hypothetical protein
MSNHSTRTQVSAASVPPSSTSFGALFDSVTGGNPDDLGDRDFYEILGCVTSSSVFFAFDRPSLQFFSLFPFPFPFHIPLETSTGPLYYFILIPWKLIWTQREQIIAEYRVRALLLHPDKQRRVDSHPDQPAISTTTTPDNGASNLDPLTEGKSRMDVDTQFQRLQRAYECLSSPEERKVYDEYLQAGLKVSFERWKVLKGQGHVSCLAPFIHLLLLNLAFPFVRRFTGKSCGNPTTGSPWRLRRHGLLICRRRDQDHPRERSDR